MKSEKFIPIVGIGASAGGLEPITHILESLTPHLGLSYLIVSHISPRQESHLAEILAGRTSLPVQVAMDQAILPDHVYVIPPDVMMTVAGNRIVLTPRSTTEGRYLPIDALFASLAARCQDRAIGIVLSGTGCDGAQGIRLIKGNGGITIAQEPSSAAFDAMPNAAMATGFVDCVLRPSQIAEELAKIARHPYFHGCDDKESSATPPSDITLGKIFELIQQVYNADFTQYKASTIQRRLQRRMALNGEIDVHAYLGLLRESPVELAALYNDLLIRVTSFFREEAIQAALRQTVFPALLKDRSATDPIRIWVPACATGEEVYSIAIVLLEFLGERAKGMTIQIFGTDLNESSIDQARQASYPESIADHVSPARLKRFFVHEHQRYRVAKPVRELCVFARQNVVTDPPFSRMDLISCCNLLIYLDAGLQRRVLRHFHYALKPEGFLLLGPAENADEEGQLFKRAGSHPRMVYRRATPARHSTAEAIVTTQSSKTYPAAGSLHPVFVDNTQVQRKADGLLLSRFSPPSILVDDRLNIVQFRGQTSPYLEHSSGTASLNLHRVAHPGILLQLMPMIKEAQQSGAVVAKNDLRIESAAGQREGSVEVIPLREPATKTSFFLILFDAHLRPGKSETRLDMPLSEKDVRIRQLEGELDSLRDYLHATNEAYEAALEESRSAQEELQSSNEEFLSSNEELVTAREEAQAAMEELTTANEELISRTREVQLINEEMNSARKEAEFHANYAESIIDTVATPLLMLDSDLRIHRANPAFYDTFMTSPASTLDWRMFDLGNGQWNIPELRQLLSLVIGSNTPMTGYRVEHEFLGVGRRTMLVNARKVPAMDQRTARILLAFYDETSNESRMAGLHADDLRKNEFIAMLAHELRNPLAPIRNAVQLLGMKVKDESLRKPIEMIGRQVTTLARLVSDLMDISRITRGQLSIDSRPLGLAGLMAQVVASVTPYVEQRSHQLTLILPEGELVVSGDSTRLEQAFGNLLNNAAKYTDRGGHIVFELSRSDDEAVVRVSDDGSGIPATMLPHIFDLFVQASDTIARADGGLGIGLTLVRKIVEMHGGRIGAASDGVGHGSTFTVHLPLVSSVLDTAATDSVQPIANQAARAGKVLVVDDNIDSANSIAEVLRLWGHEVKVAYDGFVALDIARAFHPDVALLDIGLPGMNGHALAVQLRAALPTAPALIAMSGYGQAGDHEDARQAGFDVYLTKPIDLSELHWLLAERMGNFPT